MSRLLIALLCVIGCTPTDPHTDALPKPPERNYHRWQAFDVLPHPSMLTPPHDDPTPWNGLCSFTAPVWRVDVGERRRPKVSPLDTVRLDFWVTTRCPGPRGKYDEMTIYFDTRHPSFALPLYGWVEYGRPTEEPEVMRLILERSVAGFVPFPFGECLTSPGEYLATRSRGIALTPPLVPCRNTGHPDTIRVTVTIDPPLFRGTMCGPRPWVITVELLDVDQMVIYSEPVLFTFCSR